MSIKEFRPFLSVFLMTTALFTIVFVKMEIRRIAYEDLNLSRSFKRVIDRQRQDRLELARATRPQRLQKLVNSRFTLKPALEGQIVQLVTEPLAEPLIAGP